MLKHKGYRNNKGKIERISLVNDALKEVYLLSKLNHINIIGLHEIITENSKKKVYLIIKYAENGPIMTFIEEKAEFHINQAFSEKGRLDYKEEELKQFSKDIALAIQYRKQLFILVHLNGVVHSDIKPDNILLDRDNKCLLSDFNISLEVKQNDKIKATEGNIFFYPPEFCNDTDGEYQPKPIDIWAFGVSLYVMTFRKLPFMPKTEGNMMELIELIGEAQIIFPDSRPISKELEDFLRKLLEKDPEKRITIENVLKHVWLEPENIDEKVGK